MKALATFVAILISPLYLQAHQDTIIELKGKSLQGLPEKFQPASFDAEKASLTIAGKELLLPRFLQGVLADKDAYELRLASSWYHEPEILPPYISIKVTPKGRHFTYSVLVNMAEMKVLEVELELKETDSVTRLIPVDPAFWRDGVGGGAVTTYRSPKEVEQAGAGQPATAPESKPGSRENPKSESEPAPR